MSKRFLTLISGILLLLQLCLPALTSQLHSLLGCRHTDCGIVGRSAHAPNCEVSGGSVCRSSHRAGLCFHHLPAGYHGCGVNSGVVDGNERSDSEGLPSDSGHSHNCATCVVCQVLTAPRCVVALIQLGEVPVQVQMVYAQDSEPVFSEPVCFCPARAPPVS
jgi:hypothetical protein